MGTDPYLAFHARRQVSGAPEKLSFRKNRAAAQCTISFAKRLGMSPFFAS
jgi:hypothetical protein